MFENLHNRSGAGGSGLRPGVREAGNLGAPGIKQALYNSPVNFIEMAGGMIRTAREQK